MKITHVLAAAIAATAVLTSCSSGSDAPRVAALPDASASPTQAPAGTTGTAGSAGSDEYGPVAGRPQFSLDDTDARRTALQVAYNQCLIDHGATEATGRGSGSLTAASPGEDADGRPAGPLVADPVPPAASAACLGKLPVMPVETQASSNPRFHEQSLAYVACLQKGDLYVTLLNDDDLDWTYTEGHTPPDDTTTLEDDCLLSSFQR